MKITNATVGGGKYKNKKAVVLRVHDQYVADVKLITTTNTSSSTAATTAGVGSAGGDVLRLDQDDLETVIPKTGNKVMVLRGLGQGSICLVESINVDEYNCDVRVVEVGSSSSSSSSSATGGVRVGQLLRGVEYEDMSKVMETDD